ncbi:MAG: PAS domain S-box protein [Gammaproteobacteria bacterium]|nr:PAS domain S-box protein [Gammaproteobacteria bacterium]
MKRNLSIAEDQFHGLLDASPDAMVVVDESGQIIFANTQIATVFGYDPTELVGERVEKLLPGRFQGKHVGHRRRFFQTPSVRPMGTGLELFGQRSDGVEFPVEVSLSAIETTHGRWVIGTVRDITGRKQRESELTGILERSLNELYVFDAQTLKFIHANEGAIRNLGYSREALMRLTPVDIKPDFTEEQFSRLLEPLRVGTSERIVFETIHRRKHGSTYPVEVHVQKMTFDARPVFVALILDITEKRKAFEDLARQKALLEATFAAIPDALVVANENRDIIMANPGVERAFGYRPDEVIGQSIARLYASDEAYKKQGERRSRVTPEDAAHPVELGFRRKDGSVFPAEMVGSAVVDAGSSALGYLGLIRDISDRRDAEVKLRRAHSELEDRVRERTEELRQAKELAESATGAKSRFLTAASHDLRQPLQSIGLYLSLLRRQSDEPEKVRDVSAKMQVALGTMGELLDALLDISKLEGGSVRPERRDISTKSIIERILIANGPQAEAKGLSVEHVGSHFDIHTDPALLERVIENFVTNAIRYTDAGGITVRCESVPGGVSIAVSDTGRGIPDAQLDRVFEEYFQLDNPVRDRKKGLGLGLSIVKHIAHVLGHPLEVTSELGKGSTFSIVVPLGESHGDGDTPSAQPCGNTTPRQDPIVLIVDDDSAIVDALSMLLESAGVQVHAAQSGEEALAVVSQGARPDILLSDFRLPGQSGLAVVERLRHIIGARVPAIIMTGDTGSEALREVDPEDLTVLHKPVDSDRLLALIESFVGAL